MLFLTNFDPSPSVTLLHISVPPPKVLKYVTHLGPPSFSSTEKSDKNLLYKISFFYGGFLSGRFCPGWFLPVPLLSEYSCYNRKLNITLNFRFHIYEIFKSVTSHAFLAPTPVTSCHTFPDHSPRA